MMKKNLSVFIVVLLTLALIAIVIWLFDKRIGNIEMKMK
jgi:preprotein translocase subunit SecE